MKADFNFAFSLTCEHLPVSDGDGRSQIERPEENKGRVKTVVDDNLSGLLVVLKGFGVSLLPLLPSSLLGTQVLAACHCWGL